MQEGVTRQGEETGREFPAAAVAGVILVVDQ